MVELINKFELITYFQLFSMLVRNRHFAFWSGIVLMTSALLLFQACKNKNEPIPPSVLVFSKAKGWKHTGIPFGIAAIQKLGKENGFSVDTTKDASLFTDDNLKHYRAVIFNSTTGNVLNAEQQAAFERYIQAGGGFVGIHSAADTEYEWSWYDKLMGAHFSSHPHNSNIRTATVNVTDKNHSSTKGLPDKWERTDEWYNYRSFYPGIKVLAYLDESTYEGGTNGANHPIAWYHEFDGGRAFYTGGGHQDASYSEPLYLSHLLGGIQYAMGTTGVLDYGKSYAVAAPEENRFVKTILVNGLKSPMELAVAKDGRIFFSELRTANLALYDPKTKKHSLVHQFNVAVKGGTGLIGVTLDPNFDSNHFIYLYYAPPTDKEPINFNLSRFVVNADNTLDVSSEKVLLQVPVQENSGSHHGGSLAFDKDGNLFLSTGDSTTPFPSDGYAPIDERPAPEFYSQDAQRSSANTNDFKGKVLRIHPEKDGTYTIPKGNLFPENTPKTRPEIYVMGCRNPYRIAVNPKTSVLYWGEIGPDAGHDSVRGPRGYDEFNQAKKAGNYGWPYFVGNNQAYAKWDFVKSTAGPRFDPKAPVNNSPNNTGLNNLPPATAAMIYYPYASSPVFPELGQGGRSAMAGAFYEFDKSSDSKTKFPEYYDGALFVFDWMRNWVIALRFNKDENYVKSEPFMASAGDFRRPIDLAFGTDGEMYMLEYGSVYGADNEDARLVKIEYNAGNRAPIAKAGILDSVASAQMDKKVFLTSERAVPPKREIAGEVPLRVLFTSRGSKDLDDDDNVKIEWLLDGKTATSSDANPVFTYRQPGVYHPILKVTDGAGVVSTDTLEVQAGNQPPDVEIITKNNKSFFWDKKSFNYSVKVSDKEDGVVPAANIDVTFGYEGEPGMTTPGKSEEDDDESQPLGLILISQSDCKACHTVDKVSVGPSYTAVAERYKGQSGAVTTLAKKILAGGGGNWGKEHVMAAHPQLSLPDASEIVKYILAFANTAKAPVKEPVSGTLNFNEHKDSEPRGVYTLKASYTDKGSNGIAPIEHSETIHLRNAKVKAVYADVLSGMQRYGKSLGSGGHKSSIMFRNLDLSGIKKFVIEYDADTNGAIEVRIDSQAGPIIASTPYIKSSVHDKIETATATITTPITGMHNVYFFMMKKEKPNDNIINLKTIRFDE